MDTFPRFSVIVFCRLSKKYIHILMENTYRPFHCGCSRETGISRASVPRLGRAKWKVYIPRLLHSVNEDDPNQIVQFFEPFQRDVLENGDFVSKIFRLDEATFKVNGTLNRCSCLYLCPENRHIYEEKPMNLPRNTVWCGISSRDITGLSFFFF
jgi:hypothetical protein